MKKTDFIAMAIGLLLTSACETQSMQGGPPVDLMLPADLGAPDDLTVSPDMTTCPGVATIYAVRNGDYTSVAAGISSVMDNCNSAPITAAQLAGSRPVLNETATGTITVKSTDRLSILGSGPVRCNMGTLTYTATLQNGTCQYTASRTSQLTGTGDSQLRLQFSETRSNFMSVGGTCMPPPGGSTCNISFTMVMTSP